MMNNDIRVIQYLGSKIKINNFILGEINKITPKGGTVADVFSGSGVVTYKVAQKYRLYANDVQEYCRIINEALLGELSNEKIPTLGELRDSSVYLKNKRRLEELFEEPLKKERQILSKKDAKQLAKITQYGVFYDKTNLDEKHKEFNKEYFGEAYNLFNLDRINRAKKDGEYMLFCLYYLNSYFSLEQCIEIDSLKASIDSVATSGVVKSVLMACLMHAVSEIVCSVGKNFAQPMKLVDGKGHIKKFAINRCFRDRTMELTEPFEKMYNEFMNKEKLHSNNNKVFSKDVFGFLNELSEGEVSTFYLDPPYTIDHYSRFYHILETLVLYDYPELEKKKMKGRIVLLNGRYRKDRYQSNFCIPSKGLDEFSKMIKTIRNKKGNIVLSYSDSHDELDTRKRVVSLNDLRKVLEESYDNVKLIRLNHRYRKLSEKNSLREEMDDGEILFVCQC